MRRVLALFACLTFSLGALGAAHARESRQERRDRMMHGANIAGVVATEIAFAREAKEQGQWKAFRDYAAKDAVMFVPQPVNARDWLKDRKDPAQAVDWDAYQVWSSCDGSLAVTRGGWTGPDGTHGVFTTVWRRQKKGEYLWELDQGEPTSEPLKAPEFLDGNIADCPLGRDPRQRGAQPAVANTSNDGTLRYDWTVSPDGKTRHFEVWMASGGTMKSVLNADFKVEG
ncbi:MAG: hypothetical protein ABGW87_11155 [Sphingomonadaceae bacterium]